MISNREKINYTAVPTKPLTDFSNNVIQFTAGIMKMLHFKKLLELIIIIELEKVGKT